VVQLSEPRKGTYKKVLIRDGHLLGAILLGDINKAAYLLLAFDSNSPLPEGRLNLLFDIGAPPKALTFGQIPLDAQIGNCNGVTMGAHQLHQGRAPHRGGSDGINARRHHVRLVRVDGRDIVDWAGGGSTPEASPSLPRSESKHELQRKYSTEIQALAFYKHQMLDHFNSAMRAFIARQEMMFVRTADRAVTPIPLFAQVPRASSECLISRRLPTPSIAAAA
jgi:hypothetical protein